MTEYPVFPNAPITEAVLDIRVKLPEKTSLADLVEFHDHIRDRFPEKKERRFLNAGFDVSPEPKAVMSASGSDGYIFECPEDRKLVQTRLDGFTFNKLKPYSNWELFRSEARELWNLYFQIARCTKITRIALRYINRIEVPLPLTHFNEYILINPEVAPKLPQGLAHFFMRLVMPNPDTGATAVITEVMEQATDEQKLPLILDIDVSRETAYADNDPEIWDEFEKLRDFKNDIFFNSTTDRAKELFR